MWYESLKDVARRLRDTIEAVRRARAATAAAQEQRMDAEWASLVAAVIDRANQINADGQQHVVCVTTVGPDDFTIDADMFWHRVWSFGLCPNGAITITANEDGPEITELFGRLVRDGDGFIFEYNGPKMDAKDLAVAILRDFCDPECLW